MRQVFDGGKRNGENDNNRCVRNKDREGTGTGEQGKEAVRYSTCKASDLLDKRDALRRDELVKAILKSDKTYEEVLEFLGTNTDEEDE